ncbi:MAG: FAD-binding oxidoreductase [Candidatus Acidiferrum sp.]
MDSAPRSGINISADAFLAMLRSVIGAEYVRAASARDAISGLQPKIIAAPGTEEELANVLRLANEAGLAVAPRGGGTKMNWGNPPARADMILSTERLDKIVEHVWADLTVTVEAGCAIQKLQNALAQHGQRLAVDALWPTQATVGGILSCNDSGALRLRFGGLRDLIIGVTLALPDGTLAKSGGKVVKNVAGYDLPKLATGALGTLGVITRAVFRLHPLPKTVRSLSISCADAQEAQAIVLRIQSSKLAHTALQASFTANRKPRVDILFEATEEGIAAQDEKLRALVAPAEGAECAAAVWNARQELWNFTDAESTAVGKVSVLPSTLTATINGIAKTVEERGIGWAAVMQATGLGWLSLQGKPEALHDALVALRSLVGGEGSLMVVHRPAEMAPLDAWGDAGDALPLMRAVKEQLDAQNTLNPGRFVGGI